MTCSYFKAFAIDLFPQLLTKTGRDRPVFKVVIFSFHPFTTCGCSGNYNCSVTLQQTPLEQLLHLKFNREATCVFSVQPHKLTLKPACIFPVDCFYCEVATEGKCLVVVCWFGFDQCNQLNKNNVGFSCCIISCESLVCVCLQKKIRPCLQVAKL